MNEQIRLDLAWESVAQGHGEPAPVSHRETHFHPKGFALVEIDLLGGALAEAMREGGTAEAVLPPGEFAPPIDPAFTVRLPVDRFRTDFLRETLGRDLVPRAGRFYPRQILMSRARDGLPPNATFRMVEASGLELVADFNHPLAGRGLRLKVDVPRGGSEFETPVRHDEDALAWGFGAERPASRVRLEDGLLRGPGMQAEMSGPHAGPTDFFEDDSFAREAEAPDAAFYTAARMVNHVDITASRTIQEIYGEALSGESVGRGRLLDLMAGFVSHLPPDAPERFDGVTGLGMNPQEMRANRALTDHLVHDVNADPRLPFADESFSAAVCSLSVDYMTRPVELFREVGRVLEPGGVFAVAFSNRWFPPKVVRVWTQLADFERQGLVLRYFLDAGCFEGLRTWSLRGLPRPAGDRLGAHLRFSDPVWVVAGRTTH